MTQLFAMSLRMLALALILDLAACDDERGQREQVGEERDWDGQGFAPAPACPAPHSPEAVRYQEHGGAENAWLWWMTMHALTQPSYHETHHVVHHRYVPVYRSAPRPVVHPVFRAATPPTSPAARYAPTTQGPTRAAPTAPTTRIRSNALKPTSPGRAPAWSAKPSPSYGYKPAPTYRPSPAPSYRPSTSPSKGN